MFLSFRMRDSRGFVQDFLAPDLSYAYKLAWRHWPDAKWITCEPMVSHAKERAA